MKVGDLVTLSAYGQNLKRTSWVAKDDVGLVSKTRRAWGIPDGTLLYEVLWTKSAYNRGWWQQKTFDRKDLKLVKAKKRD